MITTPEIILTKVSNDLRESSVDISNRRVSYFNDAVEQVLSEYKWKWARRKHVLDVSGGEESYDLTDEISDYAVDDGIHIIKIDGAEIFPYSFDNDDDDVSKQHFTLSPDNKTLSFMKDITGTEVVEIWYYAEHTRVASYNTALTLSIPPKVGNLIANYMRFLEHNGKRQRNDARNAMIDYADLLDKLRPKDASKKATKGPNAIQPVMRYFNFTRRYSR